MKDNTKVLVQTILQCVLLVTVVMFFFFFFSWTLKHSDDYDERREAHIAERIEECYDRGGNPVVYDSKGVEFYRECILPKESDAAS